MEHSPACSCPICDPDLYKEPENLNQKAFINGIHYTLKWIQFEISDWQTVEWIVRGVSGDGHKPFADFSLYLWKSNEDKS